MNFSKRNFEFKQIAVLVVLFAVTTSACAQWGKRVRGNGDMVTKTRTVSDYDKVVAGGSFDVKFVPGAEGKLTIKMDENLLEYLVTEVEGDQLKLKWEKGVNISHRSKILITVPFKDIEEVILSGSGDVISESTMNADNFRTVLSGSGNLSLNVASSNLNAKISGSGNLMLEGKAQDLKCGISGSGSIRAADFASDDADVSISGSGGIKITVSDNLRARISGSGNIRYNGNPKTQDVKVSGSGSVRSM